MSLLQNSNAIPQKGGYNLTNSLRFWAAQTTYLSRTFASTGTNNKIQTFSAWVKRGKLSSAGTYRLMGGYDGSSTNSTEINFVNDQLRIEFGGSASNSLVTTARYRDPSAWYHIVVAIDTTQATNSNRIKMYVNGSQITAFDTANYPAQNAVSQLTSANANNSVGAGWGAFDYFEGFMTEVNFVDGQALTPSDFGEYNSVTGAWQPKRYTGTYGTNGFHLDFSDQTGNTATTIGKDTSGNGNNWTPNNISVTGGINTWNAGSTDVPTLTDEDTANYATLNLVNANNVAGTALITNSALYYYANGTHGHAYLTIMPTSGKWYFEVKQVDNAPGGIGFRTDYPKTSASYAEEANKYWIYNASGANFYRINQTSISMLSSPTPATNDILQMAWDVDAGKMWFGINNTWYDSSWGTTGNPSSGTNPFFTVTAGSNMFPFLETGGMQLRFYSGMSGFHYTPPTGFKKLNTYNLSDSAIKDGSKYMNTITWSGDNTSPRTLTGVGFEPDLIWTKGRSNATSHQLFDSVRGFGSNKELSSNQTTAEGGDNSGLYGYVSASASDGFQVTTGTTHDDYVNDSARTYVAWNWRGSDSSPVTNTDGTMTSTVSANTTSGFSVVTYTGTGSAVTVGHGLGVAPACFLVKPTSFAGNWIVYHQGMGNNGGMQLNQTSGKATNIGYFNNTSPTSNTISLGIYGSTSSEDFVAYCFAEVEGFSKFGTYAGNGSTDGTFVYTGFRPAFIICKRYNGTDYWVTSDSTRNTYNQVYSELFPNDSLAEYNDPARAIDFVSNGFKFRNSDYSNYSGSQYIYMAFAENPFKNSLAR